MKFNFPVKMFIARLAEESSASIQLEAAQTIEGVSSQKYLKELIHVGEFVQNGGFSFEITIDILDHWEITFALMKSRGVDVPIPVGHDNEHNADKNRGYVRDMFRDGDRLMGVLEMIGDDAIAAAQRSDVSIGSPATWTDGLGNAYEFPITHVALCTHPVIPGLDGFIPIAASLRGKENDMDFTKVKAALGLPDDVTDEAICEAIIAAFATRNEEIALAKSSIQTLEAKIKASEIEAPEISPALIKLSAENREMKIKQLVTNGRLTPSAAKDLHKVYIGEDRTAIALSLQNNTDNDFDNVMLALNKNVAFDTHEKTGGQTLELDKDDNGKERNYMNEAIDEMVETAKGN